MKHKTSALRLWWNAVTRRSTSAPHERRFDIKRDDCVIVADEMIQKRLTKGLLYWFFLPALIASLFPSGSSLANRVLATKMMLRQVMPRPSFYQLQLISKQECPSLTFSTSSLSSQKILNEETTLHELERQLDQLIGYKINVNSPKQVSFAIFGKAQSSNRDVLRQVAEGLMAVNRTQQLVASIVLKHRQLSRGSTSSTDYSNHHFTHHHQLKIPTITTSNHSVLQSIHKSIETPIEVGPLTLSQRNRSQMLLTWSDCPLTVASSSQLPSHPDLVERLFESPRFKIISYWRDPLLAVKRPVSRSLVAQLNSKLCPMGFDPSASSSNTVPVVEDMVTDKTHLIASKANKKGTFLDYCRDQKTKYPDVIILTRCGDFYETYGVDAIMLVEHCGLNPMAGKAKAGCPFRNVQATLDGLTSKGFRVAVYEEGPDTDSLPGPGASSKSRIKNRFLAQIVTPASPAYLYDLVLLSNTDGILSAPSSRPYVGILSRSSGYTMVEVDMEEQTVRVSERLTAEAVACRISAYPPADPLIYAPSMKEYEVGRYSLPFLPGSNRNDNGRRLKLRTIPPSLVEQPRAGLCETDRAKNAVLSSLLKLSECRSEDFCPRQRLSINSFSVVASSKEVDNVTHTHPLYLETATQLGLMDDKRIPSLVSFLVPDSAPAATRRFLRRYLLTPPPPKIGKAMRCLVRQLIVEGPVLPPLSIPPIGKILALLRAGQANAQVYRELILVARSVVLSLEMFGNDSLIVKSLMAVLEYETGMAAEAQSLRLRCESLIQVMELVVATESSISADCTIDFGSVVPSKFFERNEDTWRGRVKRETVHDSYVEVESTALTLARVVALDFWGMPDMTMAVQDSAESKTPIIQDVFNNAFALRDIPRWCSNSHKDIFVHPRDRHGKMIRNRYTTNAVQEALNEYVYACENAKQAVSTALTGLSQQLHDGGHIPAIVQSSHAILILATALYHGAKARSLGWNHATIVEDSSDMSDIGFFDNVWPYWMDRSTAVANTFQLRGMWMLTAPNMAGKSTILRSTAAAALLSVAGLCAPLGSASRMKRFDHLFVRGASADVPLEHKSAFGAEMEDVAALLRCCGAKSLVFVDELGRGTSPRDGTRLAGAVLEDMARSDISGIFATHLHDILSLPLDSKDRITNKQMKIHRCVNSDTKVPHYRCTYRIQDGVCTDSMALVTASRFGLPIRVLDRSLFFDNFLPSANHTAHNSDSFNATSCSDKMLQIAKDITGYNAVFIPATWSVPSSFDGYSCVYILGFQEPLRYYVGETDNLRQRLKQHRLKGGCWSRCDVFAFKVQGGKTEARSVESRMIQYLAQAGFPLESVSDGRSLRLSRFLS